MLDVHTNKTRLVRIGGRHRGVRRLSVKALSDHPVFTLKSEGITSNAIFELSKRRSFTGRFGGMVDLLLALFPSSAYDEQDGSGENDEDTANDDPTYNGALHRNMMFRLDWTSCIGQTRRG